LGGGNPLKKHAEPKPAQQGSLPRISLNIGKIQPSMAADGHFAAQNVLLGTLASSPAEPAPWLDFSLNYALGNFT